MVNEKYQEKKWILTIKASGWPESRLAVINIIYF